MGNGMNKILNGLYLGNFRDAQNSAQLTQNCITHIVSVHDNAKPLLVDKVYMCITASDTPSQDLTQYYSQCNDFIHKARLDGGSVLVHCLAGVSRSSSIIVAYIMSISDLDYRSALDAVRAARSCASPNFGFQRQLLNFQYDGVVKERLRLIDKFGPNPFSDKADLQVLLDQFRESEARHARVHSYLDSGEPSNRDQSTDDVAPTNVPVNHSLSYARKAIREITELGKMRLEEREAAASEKTEESDDGLQQSKVSSTTPSATDEDNLSEACQSDSPDTVAENTAGPSSAAACSSDKVSSSSEDGPAAGSDAASVEVTPENHISANDMTAVLSV